MLNIIYGAGSATSAGGGIYLSDGMVSVFLLFFGLLFFFALDIMFLVTGMRKNYKRPVIDFFRVLGIVELFLGSAFLIKALL